MLGDIEQGVQQLPDIRRFVLPGICEPSCDLEDECQEKR
jgi:hypothetical protein